MNRKQFLTLVVLGLVIGGLGWYFYGKRKESFSSNTFQSGQKVLKDFPLNETTHIRIKHGTNEVNLVKSDVWTVKERWDYPANYSEISEFLRKMWDLKPVQDVEAGPSQYNRLELNTDQNGGTNSGTLVEFKDAKASTLKSVVLGKKYSKESAPGPFGGGGEMPVGRYIMTGENPPKVWLVNETFTSIEPRPEQWLNKDFFKVEKIKSVSVHYPKAETNSWNLLRESETGEWKLADAKEGDLFEASKASSLNYAMSSPSFNDVASPELTPEQSGLAEPITAKIETFEGFNYTILIGSKTNEDNHLMKMSVAANFPKERAPGKDEKPEDKEKLDKEHKEKLSKLEEKLKNEQKFEKWTYLVSKWTVDPLLKERKDFMGEKKEQKHEDAAAPKPDLNGPPIDVLPPELKNITPPKPE